MTFRNPVLTPVVADDEVHVGPELERAEQMVAHEVLQSDALDEADISLKRHAGKQHLSRERDGET